MGGIVEARLFFLDARLLQSLEGDRVFLGLAAQAALLDAEIGKLTLIAQIDLGSINCLRTPSSWSGNNSANSKRPRV